jgi:hypothetical protein
MTVAALRREYSVLDSIHGSELRNMTVELQHIRWKVDLQVVGLSITLLLIIASFLAGSLLGEDSIGGARADFYNFHWPTIERFSITSWGTAIAKDYPVSNNPLLYMVFGLLPLHGDQKVYHVITFLIGLIIWPLLAWAYHRRYSDHGIDWLWALFGASIILISPCFRSSAFWGTTDYFPFIFCAGTSLLLSRFQDSGAHEGRRSAGPLWLRWPRYPPARSTFANSMLSCQ